MIACDQDKGMNTTTHTNDQAAPFTCAGCADPNSWTRERKPVVHLVCGCSHGCDTCIDPNTDRVLVNDELRQLCADCKAHHVPQVKRWRPGYMMSDLMFETPDQARRSIKAYQKDLRRWGY